MREPNHREKISAWSTYDDRYLYVACKVEDDPAEIRANLGKCDEIFQDDSAGLVLDTEGDGQTFYLLAVNPLGVQGESRTSYNGEDESFDLTFSSEAKVSEDGYQVEMAIPFRSLRFQRLTFSTGGPRTGSRIRVTAGANTPGRNSTETIPVWLAN